MKLSACGTENVCRTHLPEFIWSEVNTGSIGRQQALGTQTCNKKLAGWLWSIFVAEQTATAVLPLSNVAPLKIQFWLSRTETDSNPFLVS
jgi:hypothetical protein